MAAADLILHPRWPNWHRQLQVRFVLLMCDDQPAIADAVRKLLADVQKPAIDQLMREVIRQSLLGLLAWGQAKKQSKRLKRPKRADEGWHEAFGELNDDLKRWNADGKTIDDVPKEQFAIFGVNYSL